MAWLSTVASNGHFEYLYAIIYLLQLVVLMLADHPMAIIKFSICICIKKKRSHNHAIHRVN